MSAQFKLKISLGNDAMRTPYDVAAALTGVAARLEPIDGKLRSGEHGAIIDDNGNTVGEWVVTR